MGMSDAMFSAQGIPEKVKPVRLLDRKNLYDIRDLDALIDYTKEHGTMKGFKVGDSSHSVNGLGMVAVSLGELCPGCTEFKIARLPDGGFSVHPMTPATKAGKQKPGG